MTMIPATENQILGDGEFASPLAVRLDLLVRHAITSEQFEADMVRACREDPEEIWTLLGLLDQYHRLEILPTDLFRALKAAADRYGLVRREPYIPNLSAKSRTPTTPPPAPAPRAAAPMPLRPTAPPQASEPMAPPTAPVPRATVTPVTPPAAPVPATAPVVAAPVVEAPLVEAPPAALEHAPSRALEVGNLVGGRYRLEAELDSDDRGRNFQAMDQQHAGQPAAVCQVLLHCMQPGAENFETVLAERRTEFQMAQPLAHPNVLTVRELDQDGVTIYLTMNMMRGETLAALLARRQGKALARSVALTIIRDIGAALTYAHDHGVVHGNLQPQSVLISPAGEMRVRGFGAQRTSSCYASGEQLEGRAPDRRDDLYALACLSYELLRGKHPFDRQNASTARGRGMTPARPVKITGKQWRALRMGLAWRREGRNVSIARWIGRLHVGSATRRLPMLEDLMAMPPPRHSWWRALFVLACLAAAGAFGVSLYNSPGSVDVRADWNALRATVIERVRAAAPVNAPAKSAPPPAPALPLPERAPPTQEAAGPTSAPGAAPAAVAAPVPQAAPPAAVIIAPAPTPEKPRTAGANVRTTPATNSTLATPPIATAPKATPEKPRAATARAPRAPAAKSAVATTPATAPATATRIELAADHYTVQPGDSAAHILVRRSGDSRAEVHFVWWTENASASADLDFVAWGRRVERIPAGQSTVTLLVPIIKDATRKGARTFHVIIDSTADSARVGGITRAAVLLPGSG